MPESDRFQRILWAVIGACLVAALVAIPVVDGNGTGGADLQAGDGRFVDVEGQASPSTTAEAGEQPAATPVGGDAGAGPPPVGSPPPAATAPSGRAGATPSTTPAPAATEATTTVPPVEDLGAPRDPGPTTAPRPGAYRYELTDGERQRPTTTTITDKGSIGTERRQLVAVRGEGFDTDSEVSWRPDAVLVLSTVITFGENKGTCDWNPDAVQLKLPLGPGTAWESSSTCTMTGIGPTPIPLNWKLTGKVLELRRVRIAGQVVDVWAIEATEHLDGAGQVVDRAGVTLFSPKHGLVVSSSGTVTSSQGSSSYRNDLQNLDPE